MRRWHLAAAAALAALLAVGAAGAGAEGATAAPAPRLVVVMAVDQLRPDYLDRFRDLFRPPESPGQVGGFRYLMEKGARHLDAHHDHLATETGPGHAAILTGAYPYKHGIIANSWFDRATGKGINCVEDPSSPQIGVDREVRGVSAAGLLVTTLGDELKMASGEAARVWSISYKDRSAVFLGGHLADGVLWFDSHTGRWVTSRYYAKDGRLPGFVTAWNDRRLPHELFGTTWDLSVPAGALERLWKPGGAPVRNSSGLGPSFPHRLDGGLEGENGHFPHGHTDSGRPFFSAFIASPFGNAHILETARQIVATQRMGRDDVPDLLAIGLSTNDYTGHLYGPHSPEVLDVTVRLDGQISEFFQWLDGRVDGGLDRVTLVLTADHGVAPIIPAVTGAGIPGGLLDVEAFLKDLDAGLDGAFGGGDWIEEIDAGWIYLNHATIQAKKLAAATVEAAAAAEAERHEGIYAAWTRSAVAEGRVPRTELGLRISRSFHPARSGDVALIEAPYWSGSWSREGAAHGSPYRYDTAVPLLLAGAGIRPGVYSRRVSTVDIAPTLAVLLGVAAPSGSEGAILGHLLAGTP